MMEFPALYELTDIDLVVLRREVKSSGSADPSDIRFLAAIDQILKERESASSITPSAIS